MPWTNGDGSPVYREAVKFWAQKTIAGSGSAWRQIAAYGGLLTENIIQALCRDILVEGMFACKRKEIPVVLTVHDEIVAEVPEGAGAAVLKDLIRILTMAPLFCNDMPLAAEGWHGKRFRK